MALIDRDYMGGNPKSDTNIEDEIRRMRDAEIYETIIAQKTRTKYQFFTNIGNHIYNNANQPNYDAAKGKKECPWDKNDNVKQYRPDYEAARGQKEFPWGKNDTKSKYSRPDYESAKGQKEFPWGKNDTKSQYCRPDYEAAKGRKEYPWGKNNDGKTKDTPPRKPKDYVQYIHWTGEGTEFEYSSSISDEQLAFESMYYKLCTTEASDINTLPDFRGKTQYDTAFNIYSYVVNHMNYNKTRMVSNKSIRLSPNMLINIGTGVCRDYSELFAAICIYYGIKVAIVRSDNTLHMWNQAKLDNGKLLYIDATWGNGDVIADEDLYNCTVILKDGWFIEENGVKHYGPVNYTNVTFSFIKNEKKQKGIKDVKYYKIISKGSVYNIGYQEGYFSETWDKFKDRPKDQKVYWLN